MKKAIVLSMLMFAVYACKETGDVGNAGGAGGGGAGSAVQDISVKGTVLHSAFSAKDKVCFDRNKSKSCDDGEPSAPIATDGKYEIKGKASDTFAPLIAELSNTTGSKLVFETPAEQSTISSITTIIKLKMDADIGISLKSAEADVQRGLGITGVGLFDTTQPDNVKAFAKTISETMTAMFAKLTTLGISTDKNSTFFVLAGISGSLSDIKSGKGAQDIVTNKIGTKDKTAIEGEIKKVADIIPSVTSQSATDAFNAGLKLYAFEYNDNNNQNTYRFTIIEFLASQAKQYRVNYKDTLPTTAPADAKIAGLINNGDGSATIGGGEGSSTYMTVETIKLDAKSLTSNPPFGNQKITFSTGAIMYKLNGIRNSANIDVDRLADNGGCLNNSVYGCNQAQKINENYFNSANYNIMMDDKTNTYRVTTAQPVYYWLFGPANTLPSGTYEKIHNGLYVFKNANGIVVFKIYHVPSNNQYYIAGWYDQSLTLEETYFNAIAVKDLQDQWDPNK